MSNKDRKAEGAGRRHSRGKKKDGEGRKKRRPGRRGPVEVKPQTSEEES